MPDQIHLIWRTESVLSVAVVVVVVVVVDDVVAIDF